MSTNFADAPAGDAAKGAKIFKTKYVVCLCFLGNLRADPHMLSYSVGALSVTSLKREEVISRDQTWEASLEDIRVRQRDIRTVRQTRTRELFGMRTLYMSTC